MGTLANPRVTWRKLPPDVDWNNPGDAPVLNETSMLPPRDANPIWVVQVETKNSDDGHGDVIIYYSEAVKP